MKLYHIFLVVCFSLICSSLFSQGLLRKGRDTNDQGGKDLWCSNVGVACYTFYTTKPLPQNIANNFEVNLTGSGGSDDVLETTLIYNRGYNCQVYQHHFCINWSCSCAPVNTCPANFSFTLTALGECIFEILDSSYFESNCLIEAGYDEYAADNAQYGTVCDYSDSEGCCINDEEPIPDPDTNNGRNLDLDNNLVDDNLSLTADQNQENSNVDNLKISEVKINLGNTFTIQPNPANENIDLLNIRKGDDVNIFDLTGKRHINLKINSDVSKSLFVGDLESGVYIITKIDIAGNIESLKFIKL